MGYVESTAMYIGCFVYGDDEESRLWRRTMARYLCLTQLLVYRDISVRVRKRFPTYDNIIEAGFILEHEKEILESIKSNYDKYWVPINWIYAITFRARENGKIVSDSFASKLCDEIKNFRNNIQMLCNYDWVPIPLAYPQLIFLAVYVYFAICLISRQFIAMNTSNTNNEIEIIFPFVTMMEFMIYIGWMKVAEGLLNPFGEDDDDFECNFLLDKNLATSLCIVDDASNDLPKLEKDQFWWSDQIDAIYSVQSADDIINPMVGSATHARIPTGGGETKMFVRKVSMDGTSSTIESMHSPNIPKKWLQSARRSIFPMPNERQKMHQSVFAVDTEQRHEQEHDQEHGQDQEHWQDHEHDQEEEQDQRQEQDEEQEQSALNQQWKRQLSLHNILDKAKLSIEKHLSHMDNILSTVEEEEDVNYLTLNRQKDDGQTRNDDQ